MLQNGCRTKRKSQKIGSTLFFSRNLRPGNGAYPRKSVVFARFYPRKSVRFVGLYHRKNVISSGNVLKTSD